MRSLIESAKTVKRNAAIALTAARLVPDLSVALSGLVTGLSIALRRLPESVAYVNPAPQQSPRKMEQVAQQQSQGISLRRRNQLLLLQMAAQDSAALEWIIADSNQAQQNVYAQFQRQNAMVQQANERMLRARGGKYPSEKPRSEWPGVDTANET